MRTFLGFVLYIIGIGQWKEPSKSTHVITEGEFWKNLELTVMFKKTKYSGNFTTKCSYTAYKHNETGVLPNCWKHLINRPTSRYCACFLKRTLVYRIPATGTWSSRTAYRQSLWMAGMWMMWHARQSAAGVGGSAICNLGIGFTFFWNEKRKDYHIGPPRNNKF